MSATLLDVAAVRARYTALDRPLAFFDGPGGTQCPDMVIDAVAGYLRTDNANVGAPYETSRRTDELVDTAHARAAAFLGCAPGEVAFGQSMTALNFLLTRALARELEPGDEVLVTRLDHDANVAPWLALADDVGIVVRVVDVHEDLSLDLDDLAAKRTPRTRVVAFPAAANSVGTAPDVARVVELAHEAGALAWVDAVHYGPHGPIDVSSWGCDVLLCSPYKFFGPHMGIAFGREELLRTWRPYKVRPSADEPVGRRFELGTCQHELLAGFVAAVDYVDSLGWDAITAHERALGARFLDGLPAGVALHGLPTMDGRVPTFCFSVQGWTARSVAEHLAGRDVAVWWGNYYALETIRHLGLDEHDGAVRAGIVHYNTAEEVDRLLAGIAELAQA
jgi:cysteine desulfurase family protein (TIGR01976 family)